MRVTVSWAKRRRADDELDDILLQEGLQASAPTNIIVLDHYVAIVRELRCSSVGSDVSPEPNFGSQQGSAVSTPCL
jgi:hypothetical protein